LPRLEFAKEERKRDLKEEKESCSDTFLESEFKKERERVTKESASRFVYLERSWRLSQGREKKASKISHKKM
jgi:hypothetical protein